MSRVLLGMMLAVALRWAGRFCWAHWRAYGQSQAPAMPDRRYWA